MRHMMTEHADIIGADGVGIVSRINDALDFTEKLLATKPRFAIANPLVNEKIKQIKEQNRHYLAHEYFNRDWHPMHFGEMAKWLEPAKLTYACSAHYLDHVDAINLSAEQQDFLKDIVDPIFKQTVRDFMVNQQFRRDYWVKGARRLTRFEQKEHLQAQAFILSAYRTDVVLKVTGALGEATLKDSIYTPVLDLMADFKIRTLAQMEEALKDKGINFAQLIQIMLVLCSSGILSSVRDNKAISNAKKHTDKLNTHLMLKARSSNDISYLVSPITGGGVVVGRFQQLFLLVLQQGKKKPEEWASFVAEILASQGQKILKEGKTLQTHEENLAELKEQANIFVEKQLPILKALQIA
jgi:hypothetical protein